MIDFAALQSAVRPKARTDQYVVLSALYHLGAHEHPVTARNVTDLLKLNLGKKAPQNIPACLRAYKDYVQPVSKGPPLQWALTQKGVDRLAAVSGLALSRQFEELPFAVVDMIKPYETITRHLRMRRLRKPNSSARQTRA
jgi:hypothetical protein